jgi:hypothetical protein
MDLNVLKVKKRLNDPRSLPLGQSLIDLNEGEGPAVLVLEQTLARACLKHPDIAPFDLWEFYQAVARLSEGELPCIDGYFKTGPLLQHGQAHRDTRRDLAPLYRRLEASIGTWAEDLARDLLTENRHKLISGDPHAYRVASDYTDRVFRRLFSVATGLTEELIPDMPGRVFDLLPRRSNLLAREAELATFIATLQEEMAARSNPLEGCDCDIAGLLTLVLMGHDATKGALCFGLSQGVMPKLADAGEWTRAIEFWFRQVAPVGVLLRVATQGCEINGARFTKGQVIYICPHILHEIAQCGDSDAQSMSFAFGSGPHMCPGRGLALKAAEGLFKALEEYGWSPESLPATRWRRDLLLIERTPP